MNYQKIYDDLVTRARLADRKRVKGGTYYERHHIVPRSLNGSNKSENLMLLTAREHFLAHKLLVQIYPDHKGLHHALWMLANKPNSGNQLRYYEVTSREYERIKQKRAQDLSEFMTGRNVGEKNHRFGKTGEQDGFFGKHHTPENCEKSRQRGLNREIVECPWCHVKMNSANAIQYHFDNCLMHPDTTPEKIEKQRTRMGPAIKSSHTPIECPYCHGLHCKSNSSKYHFENCEQAPVLSERTLKRIAAREQTRLNNIEKNKKAPRHYKCEFCGFETGNQISFFKYHRENCKQNPDRQIILYSCEWCDTKSENKTNIIRFHNENCKQNPNRKS